MSASSTLRTSLSLPPMPKESTAIQQSRPIAMARSQCVANELVFDTRDGFEQALHDGFFLLKTPPAIDFSAGDKLARCFFEPKAPGPLAEYTGFKTIALPGTYEGYFDREHDQWENLYIERNHWDRLPADVATLGAEMAATGVCVLRSVLQRLGVPESDWSLLTSGLSDGRGHQMLAFNHFRAEKQTRGSKFHRDSGWVTVLRSTEPGLLAHIDGELRSIDPVPGYVIINFGSAMEVLTEGLTPSVRANVHGVVQTERPAGHERVSYVVFLDSGLDGSIYRYGREGATIRLQSVADFAAQEVARTYDDQDGLL